MARSLTERSLLFNYFCLFLNGAMRQLIYKPLFIKIIRLLVAEKKFSEEILEVRLGLRAQTIETPSCEVKSCNILSHVIVFTTWIKETQEKLSFNQVLSYIPQSEAVSLIKIRNMPCSLFNDWYLYDKNVWTLTRWWYGETNHDKNSLINFIIL